MKRDLQYFQAVGIWKHTPDFTQEKSPLSVIYARGDFHGNNTLKDILILTLQKNPMSVIYVRRDFQNKHT